MKTEMEEGEIVDELDDLSDISSEEENLLRQRLEILENYNNVLERKKAKRSRKETGSKCTTLQDTSDISDTELSTIFEKTNNCNKQVNISQKNIWIGNSKNYLTDKPVLNRYKRKKVTKHFVKKKTLCDPDITNHKLKYKLKKIISEKTKTKNVSIISHSESSDEKSNDFKGKKAMLANAVTIQNDKLDKVSLKSRLMKMFPNCTEKLKNIPDQSKKLNMHADEKLKCNTINNCKVKLQNKNKCNYIIKELIDLSVDEENNCKIDDSLNKNISDANAIKNSENKEKHINEIIVDSDDDLDQLRQFALKSKSEKTESMPIILNIQSEDEDSDTKELRLICLKSALLKNAMDVKRKERIKKRLSSSGLGIETAFSIENASNNNTDIESMDMDTDSDSNGNDGMGIMSNNTSEDGFLDNIKDHENMDCISLGNKNVEAEEDEDLLRAKLLTSLSKKLPKLTIDELSPAKLRKSTNNINNKIETIPLIKESPLIINTNDSDSGSETEAAKNLTKMHNKLIPSDFQKQLDLFLKSTRMEVEKKLLHNKPILSDTEPPPKAKEKFVAKPLNHLPKSEQMEYKFLVKRMAELEKLKKARLQYTNNLKNTFASDVIKDTLKPRNISYDNMVSSSLENNITISRKKIAEESAKMLKLKEEGTKLLQKHKIVATELRNLTTALAFNKKQTRIAQVKLTNFRNQHQLLLKRSHIASELNKQKNVHSTQKENACIKPKNLSSVDLKKVKVSIVNEIRPDTSIPQNSNVVKNKNTLVLEKDNNFNSETALCDAVKAGCQTNNINNQNLQQKIQDGVDDAISILKSCTKETNPETEIHIIVHQNSILPAHRENEHACNNVGDYDSPLQSITSGAWRFDRGDRRRLW